VSDFIIGLDLDEVCYDFMGIANFMLAKRIMARGGNLPPMLFRRWHTWEEPREQLDPADWEWLFTGGIPEGVYRYGHVVKGAIDGARELASLGDVMIITQRPKEAVHDTLAWLTFMFHRVPLADVIIQNNGLGKSAVTPVPDVYVDDNPHVVTDVLQNTKSRVVLFGRPHNVEVQENERVIRARGWRDVVTAVTYSKGRK
jgi:5'(3')-deoxyribonucleotidase